MEILEDKIYCEYDPLTIESIRDKILVEFYRMKKQLGPITSREYEKFLYAKS